MAFRAVLRLVPILLFVVALPSFALAGERLGVLLMHGKQGMPGRGIVALADRLEAADMLVLRPEMPWSRNRGFDKTYPEALLEIEEGIARLKAKGASRIVLAGHSLGANAALAFAAEKSGADALVLLAPGHSPNSPGVRSRVADSLGKAQAMAADGKGDSYAHFDDINQGQLINVNAKAAVYLSFMDPEGLGAMPVTAARIKAPLPVMYVVGDKDPLFPQGRGYVFNLLPAHPASVYLEIEADHLGTPDKSAAAVADWMAGLWK